MYEEYEQISNKPCHAKIIFDKKTKEWKLNVFNLSMHWGEFYFVMFNQAVCFIK